MGWTVIRFWGKDIKKDVEQCVKVIEETIFELMLNEKDLLPLTHDLNYSPIHNLPENKMFWSAGYSKKEAINMIYL